MHRRYCSYAFLIFASLLSCQSRKGDHSTQQVNAAVHSAGPVQGQVGGEPFLYARGYVFPSSKDPNRLIIGLYEASGPTTCALQGRKVAFTYRQLGGVGGDSILSEIDRQLPKDTPSTITDLSISFGVFDERGNGRYDLALEKSLVITEITPTHLAGEIRATTDKHLVQGQFVAEFCR